MTRSLNSSDVSTSPLRANQGDPLGYIALGFYLLSLGEYSRGFRGPLWGNCAQITLVPPLGTASLPDALPSYGSLLVAADYST